MKRTKGRSRFPGGSWTPGTGTGCTRRCGKRKKNWGYRLQRLKPIGMLDDLSTPTGFCITPVVGILQAMPPMHPNPGEVAEAFTVPLDVLRRPRNAQRESTDLPRYDA